MDGCRALVLKRSHEYEDIDAFRRCRSLYQKIGFVLDKWEESAGELCPSVSRQELSCAEKCLDETEKKLWKLVALQISASSNTDGQNATLVRRAPDQRPQPLSTQLECVQREVLATRHSPSTNNQVIRVQRRVQVQNAAVQHVESAQPKLSSVNNNQQLVNLLIDWYITLGENGVHLEGILLNEGHWKTSPIAVRVGPTTVKTASGTTYNISGEMSSPEDENFPDFIHTKFRFGFPVDWQEAVQEWFALVENEKRHGVKQSVDPRPKIGASHTQKAMQIQGRGGSNKVPAIDRDRMPPPNRTPQMPPPKRTQSKENIVAPRHHSIMEKGRHEVKAGVKAEEPKSPTPSRRCSNRILMKSLTDISMNDSNLTHSADMSVDVNSLKKWGAEYIKETSELVLVGHLVSDDHHVIDRNFISSCITRRIQADLIETADGMVYRLLGPANSSDPKLFVHGFPLRWKDYLKKGVYPIRTVTGNAKTVRRQDTFIDKAAKSSQNTLKQVKSPLSSTACLSTTEKNSPMPSIQQHKRTSQMIQQLVRHNIKQSQNSTLGSKSNYSINSRTNDAKSNKRKNRSLLPLQNDGTFKKIRTDDVKGHGGAVRSQQNGSEADESSQSDVNTKQSRMRGPSDGINRKAERSDVQSSQQGKVQPIKKSTLGSQLNTTGKCLAGMVSDVGSGEFDFNIF